MPRLRMFGPAAQAARTGHDELPGRCVEEVLDAARARYGKEFASVVTTCRVWVNGEEPAMDTKLEDSDEVALLPPVSGG